MNKDVLIIIIGSSFTLAGTVIGLLKGMVIGRKKREADVENIAEKTQKLIGETEKLRIENFKSTIDIYNSVHAELKTQLTLVYKKCADLSEEISVLNERISLLVEENKSLKIEIREIKSNTKSHGNKT